MSLVKRILITNPFDIRSSKTDELSALTGADCIPADMPDAIISRNGTVINLTDRVFDGDWVVVRPVIAGGGGDNKQLLNTVAMVVIMAAIGVYAPPAFASLTGWGVKSFGVVALTGLAAVAGGYVYNSVFGVGQQALDTSLSDISQTYSFNARTTQTQGTAIPVVYGRIKVSGNIIAVHTSTVDDESYLSMIVALSVGQIYAIEDIKLNDQPLESLSSESVQTRNGQVNQTVMSGFTVTKAEQSVSLAIDADGFIYELDGIFNALEIDITFPDGLFHYNSKGEYKDNTVQISITLTIGGVDYNSGIITVTESEQNSFVRRVVFAAGGFTVNPTDVNYGVSYEDVLVRVWKHSELQESDSKNIYRGRCYVTAIRRCIDYAFSYPGVALVGIKAVASSDLSGYVDFSGIVRGKLVQVYTLSETGAVSCSVQYSNNPAWVALDILMQPDISDDGILLKINGYTLANINILAMIEWAEYCDVLINGKPRCTFNGEFKDIQSTWDAAQKVATVGRAAVVWAGDKITPIIDRAGEPVQLFSVGNITEDGFSNSYLSLTDRARELEVDFADEEQDFETSHVIYSDVRSGEVPNTTTINMFGITNAAEAARYADLQLAHNRYTIRSGDFPADIDSLACTVGDIVYLQHDAPQWGFGGRLVSAGDGWVELDQEIATDESKQYAIMVQHDNGDVSYSLAVLEGTKAYVSITPTPAQYAVYAFGEVGKVAKLVRITQIRRKSDLQATLSYVITARAV